MLRKVAEHYIVASRKVFPGRCGKTVMAASDKPHASLFGKKEPARIRRSELNELIRLVESADSSLAPFAEAVSRHPVVLKQLMRAANSSLTGSAVEITKPAHAAIYLGSRRVVFLLNTLPPEIIEEDISESSDHR